MPITSITRVSTAADGTEGNNSSYDRAFSPDGTKVAFYSYASNLVAGDTNNAYDIFVKDLASGIATRVSTGAGGAQANYGSYEPVFSPDGTKVAFTSFASNLVPGDSNNTRDIFVKNLASGAIARVSTDAAGAQANYGSNAPVFSPDGTKVAFVSDATNLVAGDTNSRYDIFVNNLASGIVTRVSTGAGGAQANDHSYEPVFSPDGAKVAFVSEASNLVPDDTNNTSDIFVKDLGSGTVSRVSTGAGGAQGNGWSGGEVFSPDGTKVAFYSTATNLVADDTNNTSDIFVKDLGSGTVSRVSTGAGGAQGNGWSDRPVFSPDGTQVVFDSTATNLVPADTNSSSDVFVKDLKTGAISRVSTDAAGAQANGPSSAAVFSPDGTKVAFASLASNLVTGDTNNAPDIFLVELGSAPPATLSIAALSADKAEGDSGTTDFTFSVARTGNTTVATTVDWAVSANQSPDAEAADFVGGAFPRGQVSFAANETTAKTITVNVAGDKVYESAGRPESFVVTLSNPSGGAIIDPLRGWANGYIRNDDALAVPVTDEGWDKIPQISNVIEKDPDGGFADKLPSDVQPIFNDLFSAVLGGSGKLTSGYVADLNYYNDVTGDTGKNVYHAGLDMSKGDIVGKPVYAVTGGTVTKVVNDKGDYNYIVIKDIENNYWLYGHVTGVVFRNASVTTGQKIATVSNLSTLGDHLHLGVFTTDPSVLKYWGRNESVSTITKDTMNPLQAYYLLKDNTLIGTNDPERITGLQGQDKISGGAGNDTLQGGTGNDVMDGGEDIDTADYSYLTASQTSLIDLQTGYATIGSEKDTLKNIENVWGGAGRDDIRGNAQANELRGNGGNDEVAGGDGDDVLYGDAGNDGLYGGNHNDKLYGGANDDRLEGGLGNDTLEGGAGIDRLTGGTNQDRFVFNTALSASSNIDRVIDFSHVDDTIALDDAVFTKLPLGALKLAAFWGGTAAHDADDRIIYNKSNGALLYDADGTGKTAAPIQFATLDTKPTNVDYTDFLII